MKSIQRGLAFAVFLAMSLIGAGTVLGVEFSDTADSPYLTGIELLQERGVVNGYPDGTYRPATTMNRAEMLKIVAEATVDDADFVAFENDDCFQDVSANTWYTKYVCYGRENGWVVGYENGTLFRPEQKVTFVEALKMTFMAFDIEFTEQTTPWYKNLVEVAATDNYIPHLVTAFDEDFSREKMADLVARILSDADGNLDEYLGDRSDILIDYDYLAGTDSSNNNNNEAVIVPLPKVDAQVFSVDSINGAGLVAGVVNGSDTGLNGELAIVDGNGLLFADGWGAKSILSVELNDSGKALINYLEEVGGEQIYGVGIFDLSSETFTALQTGMMARDFNDDGDYIAASEVSHEDSLYKNTGEVVEFGVAYVDADYANAEALNNGQYVMTVKNSYDDVTGSTASVKLWHEGVFTDLFEAYVASVSDLNDSNQALITMKNANEEVETLQLWSNGQLTDFGFYGFGSINNRGQVIGYGETNFNGASGYFNFFYEEGKIMDLSRVLPEDVFANLYLATDLTEDGQILLSYGQDGADGGAILTLPSNYRDFMVPFEDFLTSGQPKELPYFYMGM